MFYKSNLDITDGCGKGIGYEIDNVKAGLDFALLFQFDGFQMVI